MNGLDYDGRGLRGRGLQDGERGGRGSLRFGMGWWNITIGSEGVCLLTKVMRCQFRKFFRIFEACGAGNGYEIKYAEILEFSLICLIMYIVTYLGICEVVDHVFSMDID